MLELIVFIAGIAYGYLKHGKEPRIALFKKSLYYGAILGIVFGVISFFIGGSMLMAPLRASLTFLGIVISVAYLTIIFLIGTWIGDFLEEKIK